MRNVCRLVDVGMHTQKLNIYSSNDSNPNAERMDCPNACTSKHSCGEFYIHLSVFLGEIQETCKAKK